MKYLVFVSLLFLVNCGVDNIPASKVKPAVSPSGNLLLKTYVSNGFVGLQLSDAGGNILDDFSPQHSAYTKFEKAYWASDNHIVFIAAGTLPNYYVVNGKIEKEKRLYVGEGIGTYPDGRVELTETANWNDSYGALVYEKNYSYDEESDKRTPHGKWTWYNEDGTVKRIEVYDMGKLVSSDNVKKEN